MWVCLNEEGKRVFGDVFPDGKVPVCSMQFSKMKLGDGLVEAVLVNWRVLSIEQKVAVVRKLADAWNVSKDDVLVAIKRIGLPLRKSLTTGVIAAELRFFV
jgi:hypothetical protein